MNSKFAPLLAISILFAFNAGEPANAGGTAACVDGPAISSTECGTNSSTTLGFSTAIGNGAIASGQQTTALGQAASATNDFSTALGELARVSGRNSVAVGAFSTASEDFVFSVGNGFLLRRVINVADGISLTDAATVRQVQSARDAATGFYQLERDARIAADTAITTNATNEASTRAAAETTLQNNINSEATTRATAVSAVQSNLNAEANARIASDAQLTASLSTETSQRMAADSSMATRLSALEGSLGNLDARFERLDRRIAAGTAVATAMSGNAFLPDMKFNLTANVATYDGAHAGAVQMGALVSRHVAVNAGVAFGFNRGGKTAARAGMTFGW